MTAWTSRPALRALVGRIVRCWPEHETYVVERFSDSDDAHLDFCDGLAALIQRIIAGDPDTAVHNYRWTCERMLEEEYHFAITGRYRHDSFARVHELVYSDTRFMTRYTDGLLLSQLMWANHARAFEVYQRRFLARLPAGGSLLEVGPGHGLLLAAAAEVAAGHLTGWDVSTASLAATRRALDLLGVGPVVLEWHDLLRAPDGGAFDLVVASELIEHLDRPGEAVRRLSGLVHRDGWVYLNIPVNSPAPDHIALWRTPEALFSFIEGNGLDIAERHVLPMTGRTEAAARARQLTLSCVAICRPAR
jgi:2-polyprenyl-3-methyl-5-hydroxy-6-metoxy-1,4-benzoquinol methylase